jgi:hypothetical protein
MVSSHGLTRERNGDDHILKLYGGDPNKPEELRRADLRKMLLAKGARLTILITDACGTIVDPDGKPGKPPDVGEGTLGEGDDIPAGYDRLFFKAKGVVDINGAREGSYAWSDSEGGGVFMRTFSKTLKDTAKNADVDWSGLYITARKNTEATYKEYREKNLTMYQTRAAVQTLGPDEIRTRDLLKAQSTQSPQAYRLPGLNLGLTYKGTDGEGVQITNLTADSPLAKAKIKVGEVIVAVNEKPTLRTEELVAEVKAITGAGKTQFTLTIKDANGKERTVSIDLSDR